MTTVNVKLEKITQEIAELAYIDYRMFKLGTNLGVKGATRDEANAAIANLYHELEIGKRLANIRSRLRSLVEEHLVYDENGMSTLDYEIEKKIGRQM